ncbi:MAG: thiamine phosphate synthase [Campylobacterales bacterium]
MEKKLSGLYAITDEILTPKSTITSQVEKALKAGVSILQFRDKNSKDSEVEGICQELQALCSSYDATFIIDDRAELVDKIGAQGLHIGKDDIGLKEARAIVGGEKIIGVSCYGSVRRAKEAQDMGANYVAFGSFFRSPTKPKSTIIDLNVITKAKKEITLPICVIGGIDASNLEELMEYKPDMISVVSAVFGGADIEKRVEELNKIIEGAKI